MKFMVMPLFAALLLAPLTALARDIPARDVPVPDTVSPQLREAMRSVSLPGWPWSVRPSTAAQWRELVRENAARGAAAMPALLKTLAVKCEPGEMAGVPVFVLEAAGAAMPDRGKVLMGLHGGGYVFSPGEAGLAESAYLAAFSKIRVVAVDYRMPPSFPFPAALDDAVAVYKELLKTYRPENIGVFGTSAGGALTVALCLRLKAEGVPLPGAIAPGTPWSDLSKTGDSYFANAHLDNVLVSYDGLLGEMAKLYANGHDLKEPLLSPVYGDLRGLPPAILGTGTRDLFLSDTVRLHRKLREAGVPADLLAIEGLSHAQYMLLAPDAPETVFYFGEVARFFDRNLGK